MKNFLGRTAIITGSGAGLGAAYAKELASRGCNVLCNDLGGDVMGKGTSSTGVQAVVADIKLKGGSAVADFSSVLDASDIVKNALNTFGRVDILINNAGIANRAIALEHTDELWDEVIELDLTAPFILSREIGQQMAARGSGKIIFTASMWTFLGGKNVISYTAAKSALGGLVRGLSNELAGDGICVNAIAPGFIETDINLRVRADKERFEFLSARIPAKRWGKPADLAGATLFLSSAASDYVSGIVLPVDGGYLAN